MSVLVWRKDCAKRGKEEEQKILQSQAYIFPANLSVSSEEIRENFPILMDIPHTPFRIGIHKPAIILSACKYNRSNSSSVYVSNGDHVTRCSLKQTFPPLQSDDSAHWQS